MKKLHMIGHAHIDPVWLWRWQEGFQEVKATFRSALDRMNEYPDFNFLSSSAIFYEWVEKSDPAMFEEIKQRVVEGRWEIVGGWIVEPDCNIPNGESFVRQALYGQRYFKEKFGKIATTGFNPDSFGHAGTLPQILNKSGMANYIFMRPMPHEKGLPGRVFKWKSTDGSELLAYRIPYNYETWGKDISRYIDRFKAEFMDNTDELAMFYGVGNHGGGPTIENIESIYTLDKSEEDISLFMSTLDEFFSQLKASGSDFPVVQDDLQHHASGCYSVHSAIKKYNRISENALQTAEKFSSIAHVVKKQPYPCDFKHAWKNTLFNQFHDILAGTSLISAYEDARNVHGEAISIADRNLNYATQAISWDVDIEQEEHMRPIVVFNPHSWEGKMVCELEVRDVSEDKFKLLDDKGNLICAQLVQSESVTGFKRLLFVADLPAMGYRTFRLYSNQEDAQKYANVSASQTRLENKKYILEINENTGNVKSLFDKELNAEIFARESRLAVIEDKSDTWSHNVFKFDKEIASMKPVYIRLIEEGPVRSTIRVRYKYNDSYVNQDFSVYRDLDYVEVKVNTDWREPLTMLKLKFPINFNYRKPTYEIPYGYIEKNINGEEEAGQNWIDCSGEQGEILGGFSVANTAKYSYNFDIDEVGITILKNSVYAHHDPAKLDPEQEYSYVDHGRDSFTYAMYSHSGSWKGSRTPFIAQEINVRPISIIETYHKGTMPQVQSFLSANCKQVVVSAIKEAEDGDGIIIRAYELLGQHADVEIDVEFMGRKISTHFGPCEIKTFKIPYNSGDDITETNLLEW